MPARPRRLRPELNLDLPGRLRARRAGALPPIGSAAPDALVAEAADGVRLAGAHYRRSSVATGPAETGAGIVFVVAHGFTGSVHRESVRAVIAGFLAHGSVLAFDFRGHGRSAGLCTAGDAEVLDIAAVVELAAALGYRQVVTVGFSMGGAVVLRHAAERGGVQAVVSVSAPSRWFVRDTEPMRRVHWLCETITGRAAARVVLNTRLTRAWDAVPPTPVEVAHRIAGTPLLLVHGDADRYFGLEHPRALAAAAGPETELWIIEGMRHAESATTADLVDRIARWSLARLHSPTGAGG